jgi:hypothetical protein
MATLGGNVEPCAVCGDKVYPLDKFVIEKLVMHKACFKVRLRRPQVRDHRTDTPLKVQALQPEAQLDEFCGCEQHSLL